MIPKQVIEAFLNRKINSLAWLKKEPREELLKAFEEIDSPPWADYSGLWSHQLVMVLVGIYMEKILFLSDMGSGKTRVILELIEFFKTKGNSWLVCVPNAANIENWVAQIQEHKPDLKYITLDVNGDAKRQLIKQQADLFITHYPGLVALCTTLERVNKRKRKRIVNSIQLQDIQRKFTGIVMDECTAVGNHSSLTSRICLQIAKSCQYRYGLTGTPFGRDPMMLWHQFKVIDNGETLGETLGLFRAAFFNEAINFWGGRKYTFKNRMKKDLHRIIAGRSIIYTPEELQDLPERVAIKRIVQLPDHMETYYRKELYNLRKSRGNFRDIKASFLRMRQLSSGFLGLKNDETCERVEIEFPENPKIDELMQIIDEMPTGAKMLVFHEYIWTGNRIARELKARKLDCERLHGGQKDQRGALRRFQQNPACRFMIMNNRLGAMGHNLQNAHYVVFVETPISPITRQQAERRARRSGQKSDHVFIIDIVARIRKNQHSVDERILDWLSAGKDLLEAVLTGNQEL